MTDTDIWADRHRNSKSLPMEEWLRDGAVLVREAFKYACEDVGLVWGKVDIHEELFDSAVKALNNVNLNMKLYVSQVYGMAWTMMRFYKIQDNSAASVFPGGLILDDLGTGKTIKALLAICGISYMMGWNDSINLENKDNCSVVVVPDVLVATDVWMHHAAILFKSSGIVAHITNARIVPKHFPMVAIMDLKLFSNKNKPTFLEVRTH